MSSFNGKPAEIQRLSIDRFDRDNLQSTCFLLSHCHADHMEGILDPRFKSRLLDNADVFLYCSAITATILQYSGLASVAHKIVALPIEGSTIVRVPPSDIPGSDSREAQEIVVTMIPAGHCPGSVMFLFELSCGNVLYTGDFRVSPGDVSKLRALHNADGRVKPLHNMYLDTTFIVAFNGSGRRSFPRREDSAAVICSLIRDWLERSPDHVVNIKTSARYGSEFLFVAIAKELNIRVHVSRRLYQVYQHIPDIAHAVTHDASTRIHACWDKDLSCPLVQNWSPKIRKIIPSALYWQRQTNLEVISVSEGVKCRVAYSCHASHDEVQHLVSYLKPHRIEPCVIPYSMTRDDAVNVCNKLRDGSQDTASCNVQRCTPHTSDIQRCTPHTSDIQRCTPHTSDIQRCTPHTSDIQRCTTHTSDEEDSDSWSCSRSSSPLACFAPDVDVSDVTRVVSEDDSPISSPDRPSMPRVLLPRSLVNQVTSKCGDLATLATLYQADEKREKRNVLCEKVELLAKKLKTH